MKTKNKEIINKNILIAEFMGGEPVNKVKDNPIGYSFPFEFGHQESWDEGGFLGSGKSSCWNIEDLQYHLSWDWLMPVVEKIEGLSDGEYLFDISGRLSRISLMVNHNIDDSVTIAEFHSRNSSSKIEAIWLCVIEFIKKYNEHKK